MGKFHQASQSLHFSSPSRFHLRDAAQNPALKKEAVVCVDFTFVQAYYSNDEKNDKLFNELTNKDEVLVIYPALPRVAQQLCEAMQNIIGLLRDNAVFRRILGQKSTFTGYWIPLQWSELPTTSGSVVHLEDRKSEGTMVSGRLRP